MAIRKHQQWCSSTNKFCGSITYGNSVNGDGMDEIANNAIVFLINGVSVLKRVPIAYHFITSIGAESRLRLITQIFEALSKINTKITNITFDGLAANASMCEMLGANLDPSNLQPYFSEPSKGEKVFIILDPSHAIKLVRNNFAAREILYDAEGNEINWRLLPKLVEFGEKSSFGLSHKINKRHIAFSNRMMHVRTAVETLSNSVADSIECLHKKKIPGFAHAGATIRFIRIFNNLFDIMNTQRILQSHPNQFKSALNPANKTHVFTFLEEAKEYILGLKLKVGKHMIPVVQSAIKTGFRGFLINIESVVSMYTHYVQEGHTMYMLPTYRLSQDHLEMFFQQIRSRNGYNDNPTVLQFQYSFRRLQMIVDLPLIGEGNTYAASSILGVSSFQQTNRNQEEENQVDEAEDDMVNLENVQHLIDKPSQSAISFTAHKIEQRLLSCEQIYCQLCRKVLEENEKMESDECIGNKIPCRSSFEICKAADLAIKQYIGTADKSLKAKVIQYVLKTINIDHIFSRHFTIEHDISHKFFLIRYIISEYIHIKCQFLSKQKTLNMHKQFFRQKNRKAIHLAGQ